MSASRAAACLLIYSHALGGTNLGFPLKTLLCVQSQMLSDEVRKVMKPMSRDSLRYNNSEIQIDIFSGVEGCFLRWLFAAPCPDATRKEMLVERRAALS